MLQDGATEDRFPASVAVPQSEEEPELEDTVEIPPGLQTWGCRASLLNTLRCPTYSCAVAPLGAVARQDLEELWHSRSHLPPREDSPIHETPALGGALLYGRDSEEDTVMDKSESEGESFESE